MTTQPFVSIMILGWNNYDDVIACLKSLDSISYRNYNIVLVDNGSKEANFNKLTSYLKKSKSVESRLFIVKNRTNLGFTGGSNLGLRFTFKLCDPQYLLLLNGDTKVTKDFLTNLVEACEKDKMIGSVQSALIRFDKKTIDSLGIEMAGYRAFDSHGGKERSVLSVIEECREIFASCGASALYRADLIKRIGLFDKDLFATYEDFDLGWRIRLAGYKSVLVKNSIVYHRGGVSRARGNHVIFDLRSYYAAKNALVVFNRYYPLSPGILGALFFNFGLGLISALKNHRTKEFLSILLGFPKDRRKTVKNTRLKEIRRTWLSSGKRRP